MLTQPKLVATCEKRKKKPGAAWKYLNYSAAECRTVGTGVLCWFCWILSLNTKPWTRGRGRRWSGTYGRDQNTKYLHYAIHIGGNFKRKRSFSKDSPQIRKI